MTYWFEKARWAIEKNGLGAAGLVATNSIRQAANRKVIDQVCATSQIFDAWNDEAWVNEGAAVRVSLICQGWGGACCLNGAKVQRINADLTDGTKGLDLTLAKPLADNKNASFFGLSLAGAFTVDGPLARQWLRKGGNPNGRSNSDVLRPIWNGADVNGRAADRWVVDFGLMAESDAALYELPFEHVRRYVYPVRSTNHREGRARMWWRHGEARPAMGSALQEQARFIVTSETSKHRFFIWAPASVAPEHKLVVIPRSDDLSFGLFTARFHTLWATHAGSRLGVGNDPVYTTSRCVEPFPFPTGLTRADTAHQRTVVIEGGAVIPDGLLASKPAQAKVKHAPAAINSGVIRPLAEAIARAAKRLDDLREAWLNPPEWCERLPEVTPLGMASSPYPDRIVARHGHEKDVAERTLTKLYNTRPAWLVSAHNTLDAAYGWADYSAAMRDEEILKRLLALNLERAAIAVLLKT